jgi:septal ring factor EnvC (AmiA/AmiB activator)
MVSSKYSGSGGSNKSRVERRIVTSIFSPSKAESEEADELMKRKEEEMDALLKSGNELLETFKMRLEQVEQRVGEMEDSERALQLELSRRDVENDELKKKLEAANTNKDIMEWPDPQTMSALSQYVLLAGIGVFSVVLRTVLRRIVGQRSNP